MLNYIIGLLAFCSCLDTWFYVKGVDFLYLIGCRILYWVLTFLRLFGCLSRSQNVVKKYHVGWRSRSVINFGWHYTIISADLLGMWFEDPAWCHASDLIVSRIYYGAVMELVGNYQFASLGAELLCPKFWPNLWSEFWLRLTAPWSRDPVTAPNTLSHIVS